MDSLHRRLRQFRSRVLVRAWDYRQRHHARGVWFRFRRLLVDARDAYHISEDEADLLLAEGLPLEPVGLEVDPPKRIFFVTSSRARRLGSARLLAVRLDAELLAAPCLALVRFPMGPGPGFAPGEALQSGAATLTPETSCEGGE
jgi:hypothetical protein